MNSCARQRSLPQARAARAIGVMTTLRTYFRRVCRLSCRRVSVDRNRSAWTTSAGRSIAVMPPPRRSQVRGVSGFEGSDAVDALHLVCRWRSRSLPLYRRYLAVASAWRQDDLRCVGPRSGILTDLDELERWATSALLTMHVGRRKVGRGRAFGGAWRLKRGGNMKRIFFIASVAGACVGKPLLATASTRSAPVEESVEASRGFASSWYCDSAIVWLDTASGTYHHKGDRWYGRTKHGAYACEERAIATGHRAI
jgi:hypothetical protein